MAYQYGRYRVFLKDKFPWEFYLDRIPPSTLVERSCWAVWLYSGLCMCMCICIANRGVARSADFC
eukprot:COSAG01_NODE_1607_length_9744_cov_26.629031_6_plen_65_part_00